MKKRVSFREWGRNFWGLVKENRGIVIWGVVLTVFSEGMLVVKLFENGIGTSSKRFWVVVIGLIILTLVAAVILYQAKVRKWKIETVFLGLGLMLGTLYGLIVPMNAQQDEGGHFLRVYELSEGNVLSEGKGTWVPYNVWAAASRGEDVEHKEYSILWDKMGVRAEGDYRSVTNYVDGYAPFNYLPQIVGVWLGRILNLPLVVTMYICRFFNMICCVLAIYLCIKYIPMLKKMVFLIGILPMTMNQFASISADGSIICAGVALVTFVLYAREKMKRKVGVWDFLLLLFICLVLTATKPIYAFLCPIVFWIPKERFGSNKRKILFILLLGALTLGVVLLRLMLTPVAVDEWGVRDIQTEVLMGQPFYVLWRVFQSSVGLLTDLFIPTMFGQLLDWFEVDIYSPYIVGLFIFFILLLFERKGKASVSLRIFSGGAFMMTMVLIAVSEFLIWTTPNDDFIYGIQGRYFLPAILLVAIAMLPSRKEKGHNLVRPAYLYTFTALIGVYASMAVLGAHI